MKCERRKKADKSQIKRILRAEKRGDLKNGTEISENADKTQKKTAFKKPVPARDRDMLLVRENARKLPDT